MATWFGSKKSCTDRVCQDLNGDRDRIPFIIKKLIDEMPTPENDDKFKLNKRVI